MYQIVLLLLFLLTSPRLVIAQRSEQAQNIYHLSFTTIDGNITPMKKFEGKKILIVNIASHCGFTKQLAGLEALYQQYKDRLVVIGFPSNEFMGQSPEDNQEFAEFCTKNYSVTFPLSEKIHVKGNLASAIYIWLCTKNKNGVMDAKISWNFNKFLLDENGKIIAKFDSRVKPDDPSLLKLLQ